MQKIVPNLWFDKGAAEAASFYTSLFPYSAVVNTATMDDTPSGTARVLTIRLAGQDIMLLEAGPYFRFTPAVSFLVACSTPEEVDRLHAALVEGGSELMPLDSYDFSARYAWVADRWGVNWQLMLASGRPAGQKITPVLMFTGPVCGKAEEAARFYAGIFGRSRVGEIARYGENPGPDAPDSAKFAAFELEATGFAAMDSAYDHGFGFNEAISFVVNCADQREIDYFWSALSAVPDAEQCGWIKDKYGLSWQIVPARMDELMTGGDAEQRGRVTRAMLGMKKLDIAELERAYAGASR
jgi:predicted 3-demethylubiquinone-9 3-methyltransferase (glyoxalase superfamily)